uniref:NADH dehydrogenase subunit 2 n=1 Tax=Ornithodoros erraticus TaxID=265619 RepID=UPI002238A9A8|nr:NADH dehydrogenase subunit 2 [Ornithodoros erraticus]UYB78275.1 NADH dehydrogenase subunit 2 [Ornithodoros erraticus]UYB78288.1 NADH dehydrogenase subunit 2 [Ornithodoros erraticus]
MKISNFLFLFTLMTTLIMATSSSSMFFLWVCLEINMMSFIPLMNYKTFNSSSSVTLYFIIQALASSLFIITTIFLSLSPYHYLNLSYIILISMLLKIGAAPFHFWLPQISEGLSYKPLLLLLSLQKIIPLYITSINNNFILIISIIFSALMGSAGGFNQSSTRKILTFSSISHLAWILSLILLSSNLWILYILIYFPLLVLIMQYLSHNNINHITQISSMSKNDKVYMTLLLMSLGGLPPFIGFFMKWITLKMLINNLSILTLPLILSSLVNLFFYLRLIYPLFLKYSMSYKWKSFAFFSYSSLMITQAISMLLLIPII